MTPSCRVFDDYAGDYDLWFDEHGAVYAARPRILGAVTPRSGQGLEVGVGSGRFAGRIGIRSGIDPSRELLGMAKRRGVDVVLGEGEHLPYRPGSFGYVLMMTVICSAEDPLPLFTEAFQATAPGGGMVVGFLLREGGDRTAVPAGEDKRPVPLARQVPDSNRSQCISRDPEFFPVTIVQGSHGFCVLTGTYR